MRVKAFRLELEDRNGNFKGCGHYDTLKLAETQLKRHNYLVEYDSNIMPSDKRYGTIWKTTLKA